MQTKGQLMKSLHTAFSFAPPSILSLTIVDDAKFNRDILKEILGDTYNYLEAENGNQAIQMIGENIGIDLMLLDI